MGLLSSSKSTSVVEYDTQNITTNQDNRIAVTDQGVGFSVDGDQNTIRIESADKALAGAALDNAQLIAQDSITAARDAAAGAQALASSVVTANAALADRLGQQLAEAQAGYGAQVRALGENYAGSVREVATGALAFGRSALDSVLDFSKDRTARADQVFDTALRSIEVNTDRTLDALAAARAEPAERIFDKLVPWLVGAGALVLIFTVAGRGRA